MLVDHFLSKAADAFPDKEAIICGDRRITYAELLGLSYRLSQTLKNTGVKPGDRVAMLLDNSIEAAVGIFGTLMAGAAFVMVGQTAKADKVRFILNDCTASAVITHVGSFGKIVSDAAGDVESLQAILFFGDGNLLQSTNVPVIRLSNEITSMPSSIPDSSAIDCDLAALIYTSGTTGFPKGVAVSHLNIVSAATSITQYLNNVPDDIIVNFLPLSFDYGLYQLLMSVKLGATLVLERSFAYPYKVVETVARERVTGFPGVPTVFAVLLQMEGIDRALFDNVRYVSNTAAALPPAHIERLKKLFRNAQIFSMYGLTECKRVSFLPPEDLESRPTSIGKGMPNEKIFVADEHGRPAPPGTIGELVVRGSNVMLGYWNRPADTAEIIRSGAYPWDRLLFTGDLFKMDEDGYFYFVARKDDIIKSRGEKVSPTEVERVIHELDEVKEVVVVGVDDEVLGKALKAIVVTVAPGLLTKRQVIAHCRRRLESFMVPKYVEFRGEILKTPAGKIDRSRI